ncbi:MAG TPA: pyrimidine 5'-nucleotidase [Anaerolineales bacterium]|nr:pyrimidine 5'-nucleotidase [Anaerolineales bacterium]
MLKALLCDLDDTIYGPATGLWPAIGRRITDYIVERFGVSREAAEARRSAHYEKYGLTLLGLMHDEQVDPEDYLAFVHDLPLADYLKPDPALSAMLARLPLRKAILTNADAAHAERVLERLGVRRHFSHIIDITAMRFRPKPDVSAYALALERLGVAPHECLFADDLVSNLKGAHDVGILTVWVRPQHEGALPEGVDYQVPDVYSLERIVAERLMLAS